MANKYTVGRSFEFDNTFDSSPISYRDLILIQVGDLCCDSGLEIRPHVQRCHEISYIISGRGFFVINGEKVPVKEGDIFVNRQGETHQILSDNGSKLRFAYLGFRFQDELSSPELQKVREFYDNPGPYFAEDKVNLFNCFIKTICEFYGKSVCYEMMCETYVRQLVILTYRNFMESAAAKIYNPENSVFKVGYTVYSVIRYVEDHIGEIKDIRQICSHLGYSYTYISHLFKEKTGITLQKYINNKKIEKAMELLKYGNLTVTQIAEELHYETIQSFSKAFKRTTGKSPKEYLAGENEAETQSVQNT